MILYQVPEGLIGVPPPGPLSGSIPTSPTQSTPASEGASDLNTADSRIPGGTEQRTSRTFSSHQKRPLGSDRILFNFEEISKHIIPPSALCGRLVTCTARRYRVIGFPVKLKGDYKRIYFRYNLCFVFDRSADLSCYEPIVRKISRVLSACEAESGFLSCPTKSAAVHAILEQLYEDLNSYSETHITIDEFNSIELKIFPFYPNPPPIKDWMVPLALVNLKNKTEANWDITLIKVCQFIDGINHVSRIAHLADCDLDLTRQAVSHLLYHQIIMTIDIFQFSNMYTLRKSVQWLADEPHVREECGPYVTRPGREILDWPKLLHLYSRLKPGGTVYEWMQSHNVDKLGVDVRRFTSFGVIKGFLRRVHRWPVLLPEHHIRTQPNHAALSTPLAPTGAHVSFNVLQTPYIPASTAVRVSKPPLITRKPSVAEIVLGELQSKDLRHSGSVTNTNVPTHQPTQDTEAPGSRRHSTVSTISYSGSISTYGAQVVPKTSMAGPQNTPRTRRLSKSPSQRHLTQGQPRVVAPVYPPDIESLLDGEHHTDELGTKFEVGWPLLEKWLVAVGGGKGDGDFGRVCIIYR